MSTKTESDVMELPPRPEEPLPGECCGRGCERCVYVYYEEALQRWEEKVELIKAKHGVEQPDHSNQADNV
jgi:hypothetical protein